MNRPTAAMDTKGITDGNKCKIAWLVMNTAYATAITSPEAMFTFKAPNRSITLAWKKYALEEKSTQKANLIESIA